ncbi:hypothetical protein CBOM_02791 [Ceraceosorus bombacis]|uniref:Uncharacterized protein n=1 Tax=Ceraceosorus bombacis TaxID=401625 RepID=A0A0P1BG72_9BASI|nr:hypothetical protein CBOM_02791 [Ceraceosorus bombacis]
MFSYKLLSAALVGIFAASAVSASPANRAPLVQRDVANCEQYANAALGLRPRGAGPSTPVIWAGIVPGVKHAGPDGQQSSLIVTLDDDGQALKPQQFIFYNCTDVSRPPPADYTPPTSGRPVTGYGLVRPAGATRHCLSLESTDNAPGAHNSVLDAYCTTETAENLWFYNTIAASDARMFLETSLTTDVIISQTKHKELQFIATNQRSDDATQYYDLILSNPKNPSRPPP